MNTPVLEKWMKRIGLRYFINVYPLQFDHLGSQGYRMQIEQFYGCPRYRQSEISEETKGDSGLDC